MTEILVGTKKGLFVLEGDVESGFDVKARAFPGQAVEYAMRDPRSGRYLASVTSWFYGGRIWVADDPAGEWEEASGVALPEDGDASLARIWVIEAGEADGMLYAGGDPGVPVRERRRWAYLGAQPGAVGSPHAAGLDSGRRRALPAHDRSLARGPRPPDGRDLRRRCVALGRPRHHVAVLEQRHRARVHARGGARRARPALCPQRAPRLPRVPSASSCSSTAGSIARTTRARRWIDVGDGHGAALGLRLPDRRRSCRPRQRVRHPAHRRRGPDDAGRRRFACGRRVMPVRRGCLAATGSLRRTRTSPSCARRSTRRAQARPSSSTSGRRQAMCSAPADAGATWAPVAAHLPPVHSVRTA